ncbi:MAG: FecR domain-containing protein, partial [Woeseiales bacterium]
MTYDVDKIDRGPEDEESLDSLMKLAGERPDIPLSVESRVYNRVQKEWRNSAVQPSTEGVYETVHKAWHRGAIRNTVFRWLVPVSVAATALLAYIFVSQPDSVFVPAVATVSRVANVGSLSSRYPVGTSILAGETITTGQDEGLGLLLARSESLRIDANTEIRIDAADRFTLLSGRVYADTGLFVYRNGGLAIETVFGDVTDVGTQFSVAVDAQTLDVAVREGRVDVQTSSDAYAARVGERLTLTDGQNAELSSLAPHDGYWSWTSDLAPTFDASNKS